MATSQPQYQPGEAIMTRGESGTITEVYGQDPTTGEWLYLVHLANGGDGIARESDLARP